MELSSSPLQKRQRNIWSDYGRLSTSMAGVARMKLCKSDKSGVVMQLSCKVCQKSTNSLAIVVQHSIKVQWRSNKLQPGVAQYRHNRFTQNKMSKYSYL